MANPARLDGILIGAHLGTHLRLGAFRSLRWVADHYTNSTHTGVSVVVAEEGCTGSKRAEGTAEGAGGTEGWDTFFSVKFGS